MPFDFGQRVRITRDLRLPGFQVVAGTEGTVTNVHLQTSVLFDGFDQELSVADNDIEALSVKPAPKRQRSGSAAAAGAGASAGPQRVRLLVPKNIGGQTILAGSLGTVTQDAPSMNASWVLFDGISGDKLIPNRDLAPAD